MCLQFSLAIDFFCKMAHTRCPAKMIHWPNVGLTLVNFLRRWPNIKSTFVASIVFARVLCSPRHNSVLDVILVSESIPALVAYVPNDKILSLRI